MKLEILNNKLHLDGTELTGIQKYELEKIGFNNLASTQKAKLTIELIVEMENSKQGERTV